MSNLGRSLSQYWTKIQGTLFSQLEEELDPLTAKQQQLITILELVRVEQFIPDFFGCEGRPRKTRAAIARSFVAKMVYNMDSTSALWERLGSDKNLRRICGWENKRQIPSEATFSRAFAEFAQSTFPQRVHEALIEKIYADTDTIVIHNSRDATAIRGREKPAAKHIEASVEQENIPEAPAIPAVTSQTPSTGDLATSNVPEPTNCAESSTKKNTPAVLITKKTPAKKKRGRPKKGEERAPKEPTRIELQRAMTLEEMLNDLPKECNIGTKKNSKGHAEHWIGYKFHLDIADGCVPISAILTSASVHDSQVAIPLATMTASRVTNLYDLMDAAYDVSEIHEHSRSLGHVPLIDKNPRRDKALAAELIAEAKRQRIINLKAPEKVRYNERSTAERANARLKDEFGGRTVRVRGNGKVMCHLMFGVLALAADQLMRIVMVQ
jgi:hypothetical protein